MAIAAVSAGLEIEIPEEIRKSRDLQPGQHHDVIETDGHIELRPILTPEQLIERDKTGRPLS